MLCSLISNENNPQVNVNFNLFYGDFVSFLATLEK